ncbi:MAG: FAD-binding oxidoreductase [Opitutales bacterium]|nr:FAD-binding oxidoreductase [Opitutales bacterium]
MAIEKYDYDVLIVGLGLAGCLVSWELINMGQRILALEPGDPGAASQVAPGVVNPVAGKRLKPSWKVSEQLPCAIATYRSLEKELDSEFFHEKPIVRIIKDAQQQAFLIKRREDEVAKAFIGEEHGPGWMPELFRDPLGSFVAKSTGHLDIPKFSSAYRAYLKDKGLLIEESLIYNDLEVVDGGVIWKGKSFKHVIFCEGWKGSNNPWFKSVAFKPAKGEMLTIRIQEDVKLPDAIINRGKWLLPIDDKKCLAGASYSWKPLDSIPTEKGRQQILGMLSEFINLTLEVVDHKAGVRPIVRDYRPAMGPHPQHPQLVFFNGLGSKGVLSGPWLSKCLAQHILEGAPLPKETQVLRFFKKK